MSKEIRRATCWLCKTPYDFDVGRELGKHTLDAIMSGAARRFRYLQYCKKCSKLTIEKVFSMKVEGSHMWRQNLTVEELNVWLKDHMRTGTPLPDAERPPEWENNKRGWAIMKRRHLYLTGGRCQVCDGAYRDVDIYSRADVRRPNKTALQRDLLALCGICLSLVQDRLGKKSDVREARK